MRRAQHGSVACRAYDFRAAWSDADGLEPPARWRRPVNVGDDGLGERERVYAWRDLLAQSPECGEQREPERLVKRHPELPR